MVEKRSLIKHVVAVDWGTSFLKAYLCEVDASGAFTLLDTTTAQGVSKCSDFESELRRCISPWSVFGDSFPILLGGPIGSSVGWKETSYLACPVSPTEIALHTLAFNLDAHPVFVLPGVSCHTDDDNHDVMRGEDLQVLGWLEQDSTHYVGQHLLCLPGTHTKWVWVSNGNIELFKTAITGELFDLLSNQSILIQTQTDEFDQDAFDKGLRLTLESELGNFSHGLFSVRSKQLFGDLSSREAPSYLSGLLIGSDVRAAINASEWDVSKVDSISIIGSPHLGRCFARALCSQNVDSVIVDSVQTTLDGFSNVLSKIDSPVI